MLVTKRTQYYGDINFPLDINFNYLVINFIKVNLTLKNYF